MHVKTLLRFICLSFYYNIQFLEASQEKVSQYVHENRLALLRTDSQSSLERLSSLSSEASPFSSCDNLTELIDRNDLCILHQQQEIIEAERSEEDIYRSFISEIHREFENCRNKPDATDLSQAVDTCCEALLISCVVDAYETSQRERRTCRQAPKAQHMKRD